MKKATLIWLQIACLVFLSIACDTVQRQQKQLVRLKVKKAKMIGEIYAEYGGSSVGATIKKEIQTKGKDADKDMVDSTNQIIENIDRRIFETYLLELGQGNDPFVLSSKARNFFGRDDVRKKAMKIYEMHLRIEFLEKSLHAQAVSQ